MIYSIGYGNKTEEEFISKLKEKNIDTLVDVRSIPFSGYQKWADKFTLKDTLKKEGISYIHLKELGYRPKYPIEVVKKIAKELSKLSKRKNIVLMCAELDHTKCHRGDMFLGKYIIGINHISFRDQINLMSN